MDLVEKANKVAEESKKPRYWPDGVQRIYCNVSFAGFEEPITTFQVDKLHCYLSEVQWGLRDPDLKRTSFGFYDDMFKGYLTI